MALMKLIVFVEFCLIPNCFLPPTAEVGGKLIHQVVASQNNFLPLGRNRTGNIALLTLSMNLSTGLKLHWLVCQGSGASRNPKKVSNSCQGCSE